MNLLNTVAEENVPTKHFTGMSYDAVRLTISPAGTLATLSDPQIGSLSVVDIVDCVILPELNRDLVSATGFSPTGRLFASCSMGQGVIWEASSRSFMRSFTWAAQVNDLPRSVLFDSNEARLFVGFDWRVLIFDIRTADLITEVRFGAPAIFTLLKMDLIGDNLSVCFCEAYPTQHDYALRIVQPSSSYAITIPLSFGDSFKFSSASPHALVWRGSRNHSEIWDIQKGHLLQILPFQKRPTHVSFACDGTHLSYGYDPRSTRSAWNGDILEIWNFRTGDCVQSFNNSPSWNVLWSGRLDLAAIFSRADASGTYSPNVILFADLISGRTLGCARGHAWLTGENAQFTPDSKWFLSVFTYEDQLSNGLPVSAGTIARSDLSSVLGSLAVAGA